MFNLANSLPRMCPKKIINDDHKIRVRWYSISLPVSIIAIDTIMDWYLFTSFPAHIGHSSRRVSVYLLQGHLRPSSSLSSPCMLLLLNDAMSCFSWLVLRHTIFCPNETIPLAPSRDPNLSSPLVALNERWEDKECGQHRKRFYSRIIVITTYRFQEKIGLENMLFYIFTRKFCVANSHDQKMTYSCALAFVLYYCVANYTNLA